MDPLTIAATFIPLFGATVKALVAIVGYSRVARDTAKHLDSISAEIQALVVVLGPLSCSLSVTTSTVIPDALVQEISLSVRGCTNLVEEIHERIFKYQRKRIFSKIGWAMSGQTKIDKLRESLGAYKMALSIGMQAISM